MKLKRFEVLFLAFVLASGLQQCGQQNSESESSIVNFLLAKEEADYLADRKQSVTVSKGNEVETLDVNQFGAFPTEETYEKVGRTAGTTRSESGATEEIDINEVEVDSAVITAGEDQVVFVQFDEINVVESENQPIHLEKGTENTITYNEDGQVYSLNNTCAMDYNYDENQGDLEIKIEDCELKEATTGELLNLDVELNMNSNDPETAEKLNRNTFGTVAAPSYKKGGKKKDPLAWIVGEYCKKDDSNDSISSNFWIYGLLSGKSGG